MTKIEYLPNRRLGRFISPYFDEMREHFSVKNEQAGFLRSRGVRWVQDRTYLLTPTGLFEIGMVYEFLIWLKTTHPEEEINIAPELAKIAKPGAQGIVHNNLALKLRDFQADTITKALEFGRGIIKIGTGGGKTLISASLIASFHASNTEIKCLLIVPDLGLVAQTAKDFDSYKVPFTFCKWTGSIQPDLSCDVVIANLGILQSQWQETPWIAGVNLVILDEAHKLRKGNKVNKLIHAIKTPHKFGLTGTLPDNKIDQWNIIGKLGRVFYEKSSSELIGEKFLTNVTVNVVDLRYTNKDELRKIKGYRDELDFIYAHPWRNSILFNLCEGFSNNVLIMVNHIAHGEKLYEALTELKNKQVYFIRGEVEVEERVKVIREMESHNDVVCIAISAIFSTGINIKNLHMIVFAAGGKSFIRTIQSIGRGLRLNENKQKLHVIDLADKLEYGITHSKKRKEIYSAEKIEYTEISLVEKQVS